MSQTLPSVANHIHTMQKFIYPYFFHTTFKYATNILWNINIFVYFDTLLTLILALDTSSALNKKLKNVSPHWKNWLVPPLLYFFLLLSLFVSRVVKLHQLILVYLFCFPFTWAYVFRFSNGNKVIVSTVT